MNLTLTQLRTFHKLSIELNFTRTAEALGLTQPAVTQHVRSLERHFGIPLVDLIGRRTVLTGAGVFLAERAEQLLGNVTALERDMREFKDIRVGELRLGATITIGTYVLPELLARFKERHPQLRFHVEVGNTENVALLVKRGSVNVALVEGPLDDADLDVVRFADDALTLIVPVAHPFAHIGRPIVANDLAGVPMVLRESGSGTRALVEERLHQLGVVPTVALTLPSGEGIVRAVEFGLGIAFLSRLIVEKPLHEERVLSPAVRGLVFERTFRMVRVRRQTPSPAASAFMNMLGELGDDPSRNGQGQAPQKVE